MNDLFSAIPDYEAVVEMEPEELAGKLLFLLRQRGSSSFPPSSASKDFCLHNLIAELRDRNFSNGYPQHAIDNIAEAISEAFAWLTAQGLIVPTSSLSGQGWMRLSRRSRRFENETDFSKFRRGHSLPKEMIVDEIRKDVWLAFLRRDYSDAVFKAMRGVEIAVRESANFKESDHGVPMIRRAFGKTGPLRDMSADEGEAEYLQHLFAGSVGSYKNPHSHKNVPMDDPEEAIEIILLANHLIKIARSRSIKHPSEG